MSQIERQIALLEPFRLMRREVLSVQRWKAGWIDAEGKQRQFIFDSLSSFVIARIDFKLKFHHAFEEGIPEKFELEEVEHGGDNQPGCTRLRWGVLPRHESILRKAGGEMV